VTKYLDNGGFVVPISATCKVELVVYPVMEEKLSEDGKKKVRAAFRL